MFLEMLLGAAGLKGLQELNKRGGAIRAVKAIKNGVSTTIGEIRADVEDTKARRAREAAERAAAQREQDLEEAATLAAEIVIRANRKVAEAAEVEVTLNGN